MLRSSSSGSVAASATPGSGAVPVVTAAELLGVSSGIVCLLLGALPRSGPPGLQVLVDHRGGDDEDADEGGQVVAGRAGQQQDVLDPVDEARPEEDAQDGA